MQPTSELYRNIVGSETLPHRFETRVMIGGGSWLGEGSLYSVSRTRPGMSQNMPSVGGALSSTLKLTCANPSGTIAKMASVIVQFRVTNRAIGATAITTGANANTSEWVAGGTYFIDTRSIDEGSIQRLNIFAYDAMMKAEADYPDTSHAWPYSDKNVVAEIASTIGVTVDSRTNQYITAGHMINLPADYTMRETLENIAGLYGGNFVITPENKLLFVPLYGFDAEESGFYLADENGNALLFGNEGWFIYV